MSEEKEVEKTVRGIRRKTCKKYSVEEKIRTTHCTTSHQKSIFSPTTFSVCPKCLIYIEPIQRFCIAEKESKFIPSKKFGRFFIHR
jgi:hypothetical protein